MNEMSFAQKGLIFNKSLDSILLVSYSGAKYQNSKLAGKYGLPGGQVDFGESVDESFIREVKEETGILIAVGLPFYM